MRGRDTPPCPLEGLRLEREKLAEMGVGVGEQFCTFPQHDFYHCHQLPLIPGGRVTNTRARLDTTFFQTYGQSEDRNPRVKVRRGKGRPPPSDNASSEAPPQGRPRRTEAREDGHLPTPRA